MVMDVWRRFHHVPGMFALGLLVLLFPLSVTAGPGGNADSAHACMDGGYANWVRSEDLTGFATTGECASYTARGGVLLPVEATFCVNQWASWARPTEFAVGFTSSQECLDHLSEGGNIIPKMPGTGIVTYSKAVYPSTDSNNPGAGSCTLRATITVSGYNWIILTTTGRFASWSSFDPRSLIDSQYELVTTIPWGMPSSGTTITVQGAYVGFDGTQVPGAYLVTGDAVPDSCP